MQNEEPSRQVSYSSLLEVMSNDIEKINSMDSLSPELSSMIKEEKRDYESKLMGFAALTGGLTLSLFRYASFAFKGPVRSFYTIVCFPFGLIASFNHFFLFPDYYLNLRPVFRTLVLENNTEFLDHLKQQYVNHKKEIKREELLFERFLTPEEIVSWQRTQPPYKFDDMEGFDLSTKYLIEKVLSETG